MKTLAIIIASPLPFIVGILIDAYQNRRKKFVIVVKSVNIVALWIFN